MVNLEAGINVLKDFGIFEIYLPFLLTFTIFYGLMTKMKIFGDKERKIPAVVAGVAAAYVTIFSPVAIPISQFFATFFTQSSLVLVVLLVTMMMAGLFLSFEFFKIEKTDKFNISKYIPWVVLIGGLISLGLFFSSGGVSLFANVMPSGIGITAEDVALVILVLLTIGIIYLLVTHGDNGGANP